MLTEWYIGLESWVLQDGNYTDFAVGQTRQFALELGYARSARLQVSDSTERTIRYSGRGAWYDVRGELIRDSPEPMGRGFVLDFGLRAYDNWIVLDDLQPPSAGTWLEGAITLSVDPFEYMDRLAMQAGMPGLIYTWEILGIELDVSPQSGDPERERFESLQRTQMWDDQGSYRLRCALVSDEPTSSMARSGTRSPYGPL